MAIFLPLNACCFELNHGILIWILCEGNKSCLGISQLKVQYGKGISSKQLFNCLIITALKVHNILSLIARHLPFPCNALVSLYITYLSAALMMLDNASLA